MMERDEVAAANRAHWEREVARKQGFTVPWLDLHREAIDQYIAGQLEPVPSELFAMYPTSVLKDVAGKDVLCLAAGGGQQTAIFGLLGARVTSVDIAQGQIEGDQVAAAHYGYKIKTLRADMRDLSDRVAAGSFDLVYQGPSMSWIPDVREVYAQVAQLLRAGGLYRADFVNPANHFLEWDGEAYRVTQPYSERLFHPESGLYDYRHYMSDIFNGLVVEGLSLRHVEERPYAQPDAHAVAGSWHHQACFNVGFAIVAAKDL
jgi:SAM-dependent methyltransferase